MNIRFAAIQGDSACLMMSAVPLIRIGADGALLVLLGRGAVLM
jgi:hypothetical protein